MHLPTQAWPRVHSSNHCQHSQDRPIELWWWIVCLLSTYAATNQVWMSTPQPEMSLSAPTMNCLPPFNICSHKSGFSSPQSLLHCESSLQDKCSCLFQFLLGAIAFGQIRCEQAPPARNVHVSSNNGLSASCMCGPVTPPPQECPHGLHWWTNCCASCQHLQLLISCGPVTPNPTLPASLSGSFPQTLPDLDTPLKGHSLSPRSCPPTWSAPSEKFGY